MVGNFTTFLKHLDHISGDVSEWSKARSREVYAGIVRLVMPTWALGFFTAVLLTSFVGVPVCMYRAQAIEHGAMLMEISGSVLALTVVFLSTFFAMQPTLRDRLGV